MLNDEIIFEEAKKYKTRTEFKNKSPKIYDAACSQGLLHRATSHMRGKTHLREYLSSEHSETKDNKSFPSIPERMMNLTKSSFEVLNGYIFDGQWQVPDEIYNHRLKICSTCDWYKDRYCRKCGCPMDQKAKFAAMECPMGYFPKYKDTY
tara:strand:+ start:489 stop:938 length:450 start_codon:yes stop_codon:yes gene_type:complete